MEVLNKLFIHLQAARKANLEHINLHRNIFFFKIESVCTMCTAACHVNSVFWRTLKHWPRKRGSASI